VFIPRESKRCASLSFGMRCEALSAHWPHMACQCIVDRLYLILLKHLLEDLLMARQGKEEKTSKLLKTAL
jgi:hypothetical protein